VVANIGKATEAEQAVNAGGEGVGLLANRISSWNDPNRRPRKNSMKPI
jgi:phosphoenolpyruvate-protein kinase (PTS system EI component)